MLCHAAEPANDQEIAVDLCIIGAGPAGITIAGQMTGSPIDVCVLESGGRDIERRAQRLNRGESVGYPIHLLQRSRVRAFGGTSRHWPVDEGMAARPLDPIDFEVRPGIRYSGWPFDRGHLEPYYGRAQAACQLGPFDYDPAHWSDKAVAPCLPLRSSSVEPTMFQHGPTTFEPTFEALSRAPNIKLFLHAPVAELFVGKSPERVERVEVRRDDGSRFFVRARIVVVAAGGIENARLLLLSTRVHKQGLGNERDLVGRFFAERLSARCGYIVVENADTVRHAGFYDFHHSRVATRAQGALRVSDSVQRERQLLNCAFFLLPRRAAMTAEAFRSLAAFRKAIGRRPRPPEILKHLRNIVGGAGDLAAVAADLARRADRVRRVLIVRAQGEQAPNPDSRVMLAERRDALGLRMARVSWRWAASDCESIRASQEVVDTALRSAGIGRLAFMLGDEHPPVLFEGNYHHLGATRMHVDPRHGVVDGDCRVHGMRNLYIAGSSVFPTFGCSNPTLTIVALALRLADHLRSELACPKRQEAPAGHFRSKTVRDGRPIR